MPELFRAQLQAQRSRALVGSLETICEHLAAYEAVGVQELVINFLGAAQLDSLRRFANEFLA